MTDTDTTDTDTTDTQPSMIPAKHLAVVQEAGAVLTRFGFLWRGDPDHNRLYHYADQYQEALREHLAFAGYDLDHQNDHDLFRAFRIDSGHHASFSREESEWLLLLILLRSERVDGLPDPGRAAPEVTSAEIVMRYTSFQDKVKRKKVEGTKMLRRFNHMRLIRFIGDGALDINNPDGRYILPPILQSIVFDTTLRRTVDQMEAQATAVHDPAQPTQDDEDDVDADDADENDATPDDDRAEDDQ